MTVEMAEIFEAPGGVRVGGDGAGSFRRGHAGEKMSLEGRILEKE
jgi:hypothetical protein